MNALTVQTFRFNRILDALATRFGIFVSVGLLLLVCLATGTYLQSVVTELDKSLVAFEDQQVRNGYVAMSDVQRLILVAHEAEELGEMTDTLATEFKSAVDILFVRSNHFRQLDETYAMSSTKKASLATLDQIVDLADRTIENDFLEFDLVFKQLIYLSSEARKNLVQFLDDMRRQADTISEAQAGVMRQQQVVVLANLAGLTIVGSGALLLLRREVIERRARENAERRSEFLAYFDSLTEIPNRIQFQDKLTAYFKTNKPFSLLYVDLDEFKQINDMYGHGAGDATLQRVGRILTDCAEKFQGFAARLGGDEFAILVPNADLQLLGLLCDELLYLGAKPLAYENDFLKTSFSIGVATSKLAESHSTDSEAALSRATDFALYASKEGGRNCVTFYDAVLEERFVLRRAMLDELPNAAENGDLEVHLQPKVLLSSGATYGFEALVRWRRGTTLVSPVDFIRIAEEGGLILEIDRFVLNRASQLIAAANAEFGCGFSISVNLSALHFASEGIVAWIEEALEASQLKPELLTLEITETVEMLDWKHAGDVISRIQALGCKIAIDDFGSGYSSLAYLCSTSPNEIKIDRSLVMELETSQKARHLLASVFEIARNLRFEVTVEGIETLEQSSILLSMGAVNGQGFLFGRPLAPELAFEKAISQISLAEFRKSS